MKNVCWWFILMCEFSGCYGGRGCSSCKEMIIEKLLFKVYRDVFVM